MCTCGTDMSEGLSLCACKMCGVLAHEDCLVLQATTKVKGLR